MNIKVSSDIEIPKDVDVVATVIQVNPEFMGQILDNFGSRYFIAEPAIQKRDYEKIMKSFCKYLIGFLPRAGTPFITQHTF